MTAVKRLPKLTPVNDGRQRRPSNDGRQTARVNRALASGEIRTFYLLSQIRFHFFEKMLITFAAA